MSAGVLLLASGEKGSRVAGSTTRIMMHSISNLMYGNIFEIENTYEEMVTMQKMMVKCLSEETKMTKKEIKEISIISFSGSSWGLGSNGIHMLDLIAYLTDEFEFHLNSEFLDETIIKSKREGYIEFTGQFTGSTKSKNHSFTIASYKEEGIPFVMSVTSGEKSFIVSEVTKKQITFSNKSGFQAEEKTITIPFQSQLTNIIVEELLNSGNCELTSYKESSDIHLQYLNMLLNFMGQNTTNKTGSCLIT
jgi:hypothetical protein